MAALGHVRTADPETSSNTTVLPNRRRPGLQHASELLIAARVRHRNPELTLRQLADELDISYGYSTRVVAAHTGYPFRTHLNGVRVLAAVLLIARPDRPMSAIARDVG
jgi:AraC-like DNA-binding protein